MEKSRKKNAVLASVSKGRHVVTKLLDRLERKTGGERGCSPEISYRKEATTAPRSGEVKGGSGGSTPRGIFRTDVSEFLQSKSPHSHR